MKETNRRSGDMIRADRGVVREAAAEKKKRAAGNQAWDKPHRTLLYDVCSQKQIDPRGATSGGCFEIRKARFVRRSATLAHRLQIDRFFRSWSTTNT